MADLDKKKRIRSYVLRTGRMTQVQKRSLQENWQRWGLEYDGREIAFDTVFGRSGPRTLEIGFGMGQSLVEMAEVRPETNFIGIEVHSPGVGKLLHSMEERGIENLRVYCHDAVEILGDCIPIESLDAIQIFFPDPWHKRRHHKRRLIQSPFVAQLTSKLKIGGILHLATDWENYARQMMAVLSSADGLYNTCGEHQFAPRPEYRPLTKFETRGARLGHGVWDLIFSRAACLEP